MTRHPGTQGRVGGQGPGDAVVTVRSIPAGLDTDRHLTPRPWSMEPFPGQISAPLVDAVAGLLSGTGRP